MKRLGKPILIFLIGLLLFVLFSKYPAPHDRILNIQNYLITVGGIISAFVIAYLSAKIFNIKSDRDNRQREIDTLGVRLTAFRQILYFVMKSHKFWEMYGDIAKFKGRYPGLNYKRLRSRGEDKLRTKFWLEEEEISQSTVSLYCAMEALYEDKSDEVEITPWAYDRALTFKYTMDDLWKYHEPCNQIWYYLDGRYGKHGEGVFNDEGLSPLYTEKFRELLPIADIKQKGKDFHRLVIANLGSEFYEFVIPRMGDLINLNTGIPRGLLKTFFSLLSIMIFGVLLPIILQSMTVPDKYDTKLTLWFVNLTALSIIYFLFEFYSLLDDELHPNKSSR